ncbi:MAG TPA: hypothetical protein VFN36_06655 [Solirubrobacteraceae bacterium]|nr:hypothetical protein [Solirubrobacteraceae bacterium]
MSAKPKPTVIGSLPRSRPERRSAKRPARAAPSAAPAPEAPPRTEAPLKRRTAAQPKASPTPKPSPTPKVRPAAPDSPRPPVRAVRTIDGTEIATTLVRAAAELTEIGLTAGARALRAAVGRLPRP